MVIEALIVLGTIVLIAIIVRSFFRRREDRVQFSFKESLDLTDLPIITFIHENKKLNFLLDTGASLSVINEDVLDKLTYDCTKETSTIMAMDGIKGTSYPIIEITLGYSNVTYREKFQVVNLSEVVDQLKQTYGVNLHGILGNRFFQRYKYVLDFDKLIAYSYERN